MAIERKDGPDWRIHPGEILREEYLRPLALSATGLAKELHVPAPVINDIVHERRAITADTAARLAKFFQTSGQFWLNLQDAYDDAYDDACGDGYGDASGMRRKN